MMLVFCFFFLIVCLFAAIAIRVKNMLEPPPGPLWVCATCGFAEYHKAPYYLTVLPEALVPVCRECFVERGSAETERRLK